MVAITCALFDEAFELIRILKNEKIDGVSQFNGVIGHVPVSLFLTRPGFHRKAKFNKWLTQHPFQAFINTGFAGSLQAGFKVGDICPISSVKHYKKRKKFSLKVHGKNSQKTYSLCTSPTIANTLDEKEDIYHNSKCQLVDMEAWNLLEILKKQKQDLPLRVVKIVGDLPEEGDLLKHEEKMRSYFSSFKTLEKLKIIGQTGISFVPLYKRKKMLQKKLYDAVLDSLSIMNINEKDFSANSIIIKLLEK
ncbi:MAG: hypothetical protein ABUK01_15190 [Leptospirales bacterium]